MVKKDKNILQVSPETVIFMLKDAVKILKNILRKDLALKSLIKIQSIKVNTADEFIDIEGGSFIVEFVNPNYVVTAFSTSYSYTDGPQCDDVELVCESGIYNLWHKFLKIVFEDRLNNAVARVAEEEDYKTGRY